MSWGKKGRYEGNITSDMAQQYLDNPMQQSQGYEMSQSSDAFYAQDPYGMPGAQPGMGNLLSTTTSQHPTVVHEQVSNDSVIRDIELRLRGYDKDLLTNTWVKHHKALINDEGMHKLLLVIRSHLDKVGRLTDLTDEEIYKMMKLLAKSVADFLVITHRKYKIDIDSIPLINDSISNPIFLNLKASRDGRQLDSIAIQSKVVQTPTQTKTGFMKKTFGI